MLYKTSDYDLENMHLTRQCGKSKIRQRFIEAIIKAKSENKEYFEFE